jgi:hypothetical protein
MAVSVLGGDELKAGDSAESRGLIDFAELEGLEDGATREGGIKPHGSDSRVVRGNILAFFPCLIDGCVEGFSASGHWAEPSFHMWATAEKDTFNLVVVETMQLMHNEANVVSAPLNLF